MPKANVNGIQIEYETFGSSSLPAVLLIAGLGAQLPCWNADFCKAFADRGFYVIRYDNRDVGLSTKIEGLNKKELMEIMSELFLGKEITVPYQLDDMADDGAELLGALGINKAHIVGISMGGYIAQIFCLNHQYRALTLTSIYSHTGNRKAFLPSDEVIEVMMTPAPDDRDGYIEYMTGLLKLVYGSGLPFDEDFHKDLAGQYFDRCFYPEGIIKHYLAILSQKDRSTDLSRLTVPTLVIHGDEDPMVPLAGGRATAEAITNAKLKIIEGMGHVMPNVGAYWSEILDEMVSHMSGASSVES